MWTQPRLTSLQSCPNQPSSGRNKPCPAFMMLHTAPLVGAAACHVTPEALKAESSESYRLPGPASWRVDNGASLIRDPSPAFIMRAESMTSANVHTLAEYTFSFELPGFAAVNHLWGPGGSLTVLPLSCSCRPISYRTRHAICSFQTRAWPILPDCIRSSYHLAFSIDMEVPTCGSGRCTLAPGGRTIATHVRR